MTSYKRRPTFVEVGSNSGGHPWYRAPRLIKWQKVIVLAAVPRAVPREVDEESMGGYAVPQ